MGSGIYYSICCSVCRADTFAKKETSGDKCDRFWLQSVFDPAHAGQLWPLQAICRVIGIPVLNEYEKSHIKLYLTSGAGGWAIPFRTESHAAWELITLTPGE